MMIFNQLYFEPNSLLLYVWI